jgi:hypothetical protein
MSDHVCGIRVLGLDEFGDVRREFTYTAVPRTVGFVRTVVSTLIRNKNPIPRVDEWFDILVPPVPELRISMEQDDERIIRVACCNDVQIDVVHRAVSGFGR